MSPTAASVMYSTFLLLKKGVGVGGLVASAVGIGVGDVDGSGVGVGNGVGFIDG